MIIVVQKMEHGHPYKVTIYIQKTLSSCKSRRVLTGAASMAILSQVIATIIMREGDRSSEMFVCNRFQACSSSSAGKDIKKTTYSSGVG